MNVKNGIPILNGIYYLVVCTQCIVAKYGTVPYLIVANPESSWQGYLSLSSFGSSIFQLNSLLCYEAQVVQRSENIYNIREIFRKNIIFKSSISSEAKPWGT